MSRSFSPSAGSDSITFLPGAAPPDQGPITIAILAKAASLTAWTGWLISGRTAGGVWGLLTSNNGGPRLFAENDFGAGVTGLSTSWRWYVMTKAAGAALPRIHIGDLAGGWTHTNDTFAVNDGSGPITSIVLGSNGTNGWRGSIAVAAAWDSVLNDSAIEATMTLKASDVFSAVPTWMVRLNQTSTATAVPDDTPGGGNQSAIIGTSIDVDDPPGFDYALTVTPPPVTPPMELPQGSWWGLESTLDAARAVIAYWERRPPVACPNDGEPLRRSPDGILFCPFDNWRPGRQNVRRHVINRDWGRLRGIKQAAAADAARNQLLLACPNDGEPLSFGAHGERFCKYDGWMPDPVS